jgi:hypothetical protein
VKGAFDLGGVSHCVAAQISLVRASLVDHLAKSLSLHVCHDVNVVGFGFRSILLLLFVWSIFLQFYFIFRLSLVFLRFLEKSNNSILGLYS